MNLFSDLRSIHTPLQALTTIGLCLCFMFLSAVELSAIEQQQKPASTKSDSDAEEEDELSRVPGLVANYVSPAGPAFTTIDDHAGFRMNAGQTVDVRLPLQGWLATWRGVLEIRSPGKYQFSAEASGPLRIQVGEAAVFESKAPSTEVTPGQPVELQFGLQPIEIHFTQSGTVPYLRLFWQGENFAREPISPQVLGHRKTQAPVTNPFLTGWLHTEEHSCVACHQPGTDGKFSRTLLSRPGPNLTESGSRLNAGWIYHWLGNPTVFRPEAVMPQMFTNDPRGQLERYAVALFLTAQGTRQQYPVRKLNAPQIKQFTEAGKKLYEVSGCVVCHEKQGETPARATLQWLGQKTSREFLAQFIQKPSTIDPAGRMPGFTFTQTDDAFRIATYLTERDAEVRPQFELPPLPTVTAIQEALSGKKLSAAEVLDLAASSPEELLVKLGRQVMHSKRCTNCHEFKLADEKWTPIPAQHNFEEIVVSSNPGCLAEKHQGAGNAVLFGNTLNRKAVQEFFGQIRHLYDLPAPRQEAQLTSQRLNCLGCHDRNGKGGLSPDLMAKWVVNQTEQSAESFAPPTLTGVTDRLNANYLQQVLEQGRRSRPWMDLKMPQFAASHVHSLPVGIAAIDGDSLQTEPFKPQSDQQLIQAGRTLVGEKGFGCIKCHDMFGIPGLGTRGPELLQVVERVNANWYHRWMTDPQRLQPGTRMPSFFPNGKSALVEILKGDPQQQQLAIWQYLLAAKGLPYPDGLKSKSPEILAASNRPQLIRTFLPGTTPRGIAIQSPNAIHMAFDGQACHLAYAWTGEFLDMSPVWSGRGGQRAGIKGAIFWTSPAGFPWEVTDSTGVVPDFTNRGKDTAWGAELPHDGQLHPSRLHFKSYSTKSDRPMFQYELDLPDGRKAGFKEQIRSLKDNLSAGVEREFEIQGHPGQFAWFHVARLDSPPEWMVDDARKGTMTIDGTAPVEGVVIGKMDGKPIVFSIKNCTTNAHWKLVDQGGKSTLVVRIPFEGSPPSCQLKLLIRRPVDELPTTLNEIIHQERMNASK